VNGVPRHIARGFGALHQRLRTLITKRFYRNRYDYREVWLRLSRTLAAQDEDAPLPDRSVKALADIVGSSRGELWFSTGSPAFFESYGAWGIRRPTEALLTNSPLLEFLADTRWVLDSAEYDQDPARYAHALESDPRFASHPSIVVPLIHESALIGVVRLDRPDSLRELSYEDHDLLKTAGQQVAIFLVHARSQDELSQTRQFEAFSKLTAFLMHDLKNLIAQQALVVGNARRFKSRPEFIDDAVRTMEASVERMKKLLERLKEDSIVEKASLIDVSELVREVCDSCSDRRPLPRLLSTGSSAVWVAMDRERLSMALAHAVRNAQDATPDDGQIQLRLSSDGEAAVIEVVDSGCGMDPEFVRNRLFKPFDSTKGARGMGIGAYQIRETLRMAHGEVVVKSQPGEGTCVMLRVPLVRADAPPPALTG